ncbi:MAG: type III pantothenate kinase [Limisphaerales bacterium]
MTTLLLDIGNTHTHAALARGSRMGRPMDVPTRGWRNADAPRALLAWLASRRPDTAAFCSVVPAADAPLRRWLRREFNLAPLELTAATARGIMVDYPRPETIGADRLANAIAARHLFGAPVLVVDFGTAVTFDIVDRRGAYVGGVIAPGLSAMTDYLHEKTALLPRIRIREVRSAIGRSTEEAMLVGAVHGYRGLVRGLIGRIRGELGAARLPVIATGGCAKLIARGVPEIRAVCPALTLEGLRLAATAQE